jgi:hypothetical protein
MVRDQNNQKKEGESKEVSGGMPYELVEEFRLITSPF